MIARLDRYLAAQLLGAFAAVVGIVLSIMLLEHLPSLLELVRVAGHARTIIAQSVLGLLPEYLGLGLIFGLYLAIALTVRRMTLRGELEAIEAAGVGPARWLRIPASAVMLVAAATFLNQGWLLPAGEASLAEITRRVASGDFGYSMAAGEFVDLGHGASLRFDRVDAAKGTLEGIFLETPDRTYSARDARVGIGADQQMQVELRDGQSVDRQGRHAMSFALFLFDSRDPAAGPSGRTAADPLREVPLGRLLTIPGSRARANAVGRGLWVLLAVFTAVCALVVGKPPKRGAGTVGLFAGLVLTVVMIKLIAFVAGGGTGYPLAGGAAVAALGTGVCVCLIAAERALGAGFFDRWAANAGAGLARRFMVERPASAGPRTALAE